MTLKWSWLFILLGLILGCNSTKDSRRTQELLGELQPRLAQLRDGMRRSEVEAVLKPVGKQTGRINISGILISDYKLTGDIKATLWFSFPPNVKTIEDAETSTWSDDVLCRKFGSVHIYVGHGKWLEKPLSQL